MHQAFKLVLSLILVCPALGGAHPVTEWMDVNSKISNDLPTNNWGSTLEEDSGETVRVAMFEAANAIERKYRPYHFKGGVSGPCDVEAASSFAAYFVLVGIYPDRKSLLDETLTRMAAGRIEDEKIACARTLGEAVAHDLVSLRKAVELRYTETYRPATKPGRWTAEVPPAMYDLRKAHPWAIESVEKYFPPRPPDLRSRQWAEEYNEVKSLGRVDSATRTADQTAAALFWDGSGSRRNLWLAVMDLPDLTFLQKTRISALYALVSADAFLVTRRAKLHYLFWRPVTAIRNGDRDGNPQTQRDASWLPLGEGSRTGEYPCGHCQSAAAYWYTLPALIGHEIPGGFDLTDGTGKKWHFDTVEAMALEGSKSRVWLGAHYWGTAEATHAMVKRIADDVLAKYLTPLQ